MLRLLPTNGDQVTSAWLVRRLHSKLGLPKRTAIRWLKEAESYRPAGPYPLVSSFRSGRQRLYGLNMTGLMGPVEAEWFLRGAPIGFLREAPKLTADYEQSSENMTLFWEQSSSALVLSIQRVIGAAQGVTFAQVHNRAVPSVQVARAQADVFIDVFIRPWVSDLVAALHLFLENERLKNEMAPRLPDSGPPGKPGQLSAPMAMDAFREGWDWASGPQGAAHKTWIALMTAGPWGELLESCQACIKKPRQSDLPRRQPPLQSVQPAGNH